MIENIRPILRVEDLQRSISFYVDVLGFHCLWVESGMAGVARNDWQIMLCERYQGQPGTWLWIGLDDAAAMYEDLATKGVTVYEPLTNYPWAYEFKIQDPDGHVLRFGSEPRDDIPYVAIPDEG